MRQRSTATPEAAAACSSSRIARRNSPQRERTSRPMRSSDDASHQRLERREEIVLHREDGDVHPVGVETVDAGQREYGGGDEERRGKPPLVDDSIQSY